MLLGAARLLLDRRADLAGRVLLMFQPGEEGFGGARYMLDEGLLDVPTDGSHGPVDAAFAIHIGARYPTGAIRLRAGAQMASSDVLRITVEGKGGHASAPHLAVDPITVAAEIVLALQVAVTRGVDPFDPAVITIAKLTAGTTNNIIPETAELLGTIRSVSEETRAAVKERIARLVEGICSAHGATGKLEIDPGYPVTANDDEFAAFVLGVASDLVGADAVEPLKAPIMGAEDFSYVLQKVPGAMAFLGSVPAGRDPETVPQNHSNLVVFDEEAMPVGIALYAAVALRHLGGR
jgi:hippurate hydrolase